MENILDQLIWGNRLSNWLTAFAIIAFICLLIRLLKVVVIRRIERWAARTTNVWDDFGIAVADGAVIPLLYLSAFYYGLKTLVFTEKTFQVINVAYLIAATFFVLKMVSMVFRKFIVSYIHRNDDGDEKEKQASGLIAIANIVIWVVGFIFLLDNLGYNVTTLIAGLGVGGIAIALAAQTVLGDLFSYFVIFFDRPFQIGDFIVIGDKNGTVEYIGIKTTRIRTLSGEQLICSNTDLTNSRLHNFKRMQRRRIVFSLGVTYDTASGQLAEIPAIIKNIISQDPLLQFDRGHFSGYGDFSLNFEFVYFVLSPDYNVYMDCQQQLYLKIFCEFEARGIQFAYPTQTVLINHAAAD
ncbi:mechanosensitive ion channel family protein [Pedobacter sp. JY14-1]|uniref:mechanosensitive ion channel family protein n=1 Tax=Pedobacter sp. JY14-1 TaxID=3034151 RepID=UPI0023E16279|nr:mechanosensitive ion channel family protein [Pedobacter sp. JY14-1]